MPPARGLRPGQAARRAAVPRRDRGRARRHDRAARARCSATAGSGVMALLFEFVADGAPVFVLGRRRQPLPARARGRSRRRVPARRRSRGPVGLQRRRARVRHDARDAAGARRPRADRLARAVAAGRAGPASRCRRSPSLGLAPFAPYHWLLYSESLYFDVTKARTELGWEPKHSNASMVIESYEWFLAHRARRRRRGPLAPSVAGPARAGAGVEGAAVSRPPAGRSYTSGSVDPALEVDPRSASPPIRPSPSTESRSTSRRDARPPARRSPRCSSAALLVVLAFPLVVALVAAAAPALVPAARHGADRDPRPRRRDRPPAADRAGRSHRSVRARTAGAIPGRSASTRCGRCGSCSAARRTDCSRRRSCSTSSRWGSSLWMALRRGGRALLLAIAAVLAVLTRAYGAFLLTLPVESVPARCCGGSCSCSRCGR